MIVVEPPRKPEFQVLREYMKERYGELASTNSDGGDDDNS